MSGHRAPDQPLLRLSFRGRVLLAAVTFGALLLATGGVALGAALGGQVTCQSGVDLLVHPDGTWTCGQPSTSPSATPSPSSSPTPTPSPSASPTSTPTPSPSTSTTAPATTPPAPSPTSTGPLTNCLAKPSACGLPDASNTGVPAGTTLTVVVQGDLHVTQAGAVVDGKDVRGCVWVEAANVVIRNTRVTCPVNWAVRNVANNGLTVVDSDLICGPDGYTGINGRFTALRVDVGGCENGFQPDNGTVIKDSYIHDLNTCCGAHADGAELGEGAHDITFDHNTILGAPLPAGNAAITFWDATGAQNYNMKVTNNLLAGGGYTLRCGKVGSAVNVVISGNRFGPAGFGPSLDCAVGGEVWSGNVRDSDGTALAAA